MSESPAKVAFITGASYGVGAACALTLARDGFDLALTATRAANLGQTLAHVATLGRRVLALDLDLASQASLDAATDAALSAFGRIDVLVNNAGVNLARNALDVTRADWDQVIGANLTGTFFLTQRIGRHMIAQGIAGRIVTVSSTHALVGAVDRSAYGISKAGLLQMTRMLAIEWAPHGITVNAVAPGRMDTASPSRAGTANDPAYMAALLARVPLNRLATPEDIAAAIAFLAGPSAGAITGQTVVIDGGMTVV